MTVLEGGTFFKKPRCLEMYLTFVQTLKFVTSFTDRVQCLSRFRSVHCESQAFICKTTSFYTLRLLL